MGGDPIETAPKDGRMIVVGSDDSGEFVMKWDATATNPMFAGDVVGMWVAYDGLMTWFEHPLTGPKYWRHFYQS